MPAFCCGAACLRPGITIIAEMLMIRKKVLPTSIIYFVAFKFELLRIVIRREARDITTLTNCQLLSRSLSMLISPKA